MRYELVRWQCGHYGEDGWMAATSTRGVPTRKPNMGGGDSRTWPSQLTTSTMDGTGGVTTTRKQFFGGVPRNLK